MWARDYALVASQIDGMCVPTGGITNGKLFTEISECLLRAAHDLIQLKDLLVEGCLRSGTPTLGSHLQLS